MGQSAFPGIKKGRVGRPSIYTREILDGICARVANGEAVRWILIGPDMPHRSTFQRWLARAHLTARLKAALIAAGQWPIVWADDPKS
jgi:hypothetical protein